MMIDTTHRPDAVPFPMEFSPIVTTKRMPRKRKSVSFFPKVFAQRTLHRIDFTAEEMQNTWYSTSELREIKKSSKMLAIKLSVATTTDDGNDETSDCLRGLEGRTLSGLKTRRRTKAIARNAVLREQSRQRKWGLVDADRIADEYYECTECSSFAANMVGLRDQAAAKELHNEPAATAPIGASLPPIATSGPGACRRKSMAASALGDSARSIQRIASISSRRLISDAIFAV